MHNRHLFNGGDEPDNIYDMIQPGYIAISKNMLFYDGFDWEFVMEMLREGYHVVNEFKILENHADWYAETGLEDYLSLEEFKNRYDAIDFDKYEKYLPEKSYVYWLIDIADNPTAIEDHKKKLDEYRRNRRRVIDYSGFVYVIQSETGLYKIGRTKTPRDRMRVFGVKLPMRVSFKYLIKTDNSKKLEEQLHAEFNGVRLDGEWFDLTEKELTILEKLANTDVSEYNV